MRLYYLDHIETPRLLIKPIRPGDELALNEAINTSLESLRRWMPWAKDPSLEATRRFVHYAASGWNYGDAHTFPFVVFHKQANKIISAACFGEESCPEKDYYEVGYWLETSFQGQGLISEVTNALTRYAFSE